MSRAQSYRFATEHSVNRRNVSQSLFEAGVAFDKASNDYMGNAALVMYSNSGKYVAWYNPAERSGFVAATGLANNG